MDPWLHAVFWGFLHALAGAIAGLAWGAGLCLWHSNAARPHADSAWVWYAPAILVWVACLAMARSHRSVLAAMVGAPAAALGLVVTQVGMERLIEGPPEDISTGMVMFMMLVVEGLPVAVIGALSAGVAASMFGRAHRRRMAGCCVACGYSLAGLASGVCPECGRAV